jgi:hypothetical protein
LWFSESIFLVYFTAERKRTLDRPTSRWEDNIKTDLIEEGCGYMD